MTLTPLQQELADKLKEVFGPLNGSGDFIVDQLVQKYTYLAANTMEPETFEPGPMRMTFKSEDQLHEWLRVNDPFISLYAPACHSEGWKLYFKGVGRAN